MASRLDPHALLCENCGYHLAGLATDGACPECGKPIAESLASNRVGSPWQRKPGIGSLAATNLLVLRRPTAVWSTVVLGSRSRSLALANLGLAASFPSLVVLATEVRLDEPLLGVPEAIGDALLTAIYLYTPLLLAAVIEHYGIRFFGRNHRWRVTKDVARAVVAHSTPGWLVASLLLALIIGVDQFVSLSPYVPGIRLPIGIVLALGAIFLGLLAFETLVYIGMRRMRFANPPESACVQTDNRSTGRDQ